MVDQITLTDAQYLAALKRNRERIADGLEFAADDSDMPGNKFTEASWGLCDTSRDLWPEETNLFPHIKGRFAPKYRQAKHKCPMDTRENPTATGCFYSCRIFKTREVKAKDRARALELYDAQIARATPPEPHGLQHD
jgi:hypothetical protein